MFRGAFFLPYNEKLGLVLEQKQDWRIILVSIRSVPTPQGPGSHSALDGFPEGEGIIPFHLSVFNYIIVYIL